jgi:uncharacterized membrane protein
MKKVLLLLSAFFAFFLAPQIASAVVVVSPKIEKLYGFDVKKLNLEASDILNLDAKTIETKTGQKLSAKQKATLKIAKWQAKLMKKMGKSDAQVMNSIAKPNFKFDWLGFALGFFLGLIGVLLAYLVMDSKDAGISALIGCGVIVIIGIGLWIILGVLGAASSVI